MLKIIHLFRHGQTDWNNLRRMQGHTDIPLNLEGRKQAETLQPYFQENPVELFGSSDLQRAKETATIANAQLLRPLVIFPGFREVYLGTLEGMTLEEAHEEFGMDAWEKWTSIHPAHDDFRFPQAESAREAIERFTQTLKQFCREHSFAHAGLCTHGFVMRRFLHTLRPDLGETLPTPNCVVYKVQWDEKSERFSFLL